MKKQSGVCGYGLVAIIKFVNATERFVLGIIIGCQSQWPCGLRRRSVAARLLR
jgi:hypothetical protein